MLNISRNFLVWGVVLCLGSALSARAQDSDAAPPAAANAPASPGAAEAPLQPIVAPARVQLMDRWLAHLADHARASRTSTAVWSFVDAGILVGGGLELMLGEKRIGNSFNWERVTTAGLVFGLAVIDIGSGIMAAGTSQTDEVRYARWRSLREVDDVALARFEGELAIEAEFNRRVRVSAMVSSIGLAVCSGAIIGLTPTAKLQSEWATLSYAIGGAALAVAIWKFIVAATGESANERAYRLYSAGTSPEQAAYRMQVVPALAAHGGGLGIAGFF